jgi:Fe-Mn family superoxide dismutase
MHTYEPRTFMIPELDGISAKSVEEHLALYAAYVKNFNAITSLTGELMKDSEKNAHAISELMRRRSFEFGGMRLHELYFSQFEGGASTLDAASALGKALTEQYGNPDYAIAELRHVAMMRGPGWSLLYWDAQAKQFLVGFSGEQHQGHFATLPVVLALDVWEHAFLLDYGALGKGTYVDAFFKNLNWKVLADRFAQLQ